MKQADPALESSSRPRFKKTLILSALLSIALGYLVLREMDFAQTRRILLAAQWHYLPYLLLLAGLRNLVRGLRLYLMSPDSASKTAYFLAISAQNFFFLTLPAILGEVSLVYILRKVLHTSLHQSITNVAIGRLFDIVVYVVFSCLIIALAPTDTVGTLLRGMAFLMLTLVVLSAAVVVLFRVRRKLRPRTRLAASLAGQLDLFEFALSALSDRHMLARVAALTVVNYLLNVAAFVLSVYIVYPYLPVLTSIVLNIFTTPVFLLPVKGIGNFGTHEAAYFYGLQLLGVAKQGAIGIAVGTHIIDLMIGSIMTIAGIAGLYLLGRKRLALVR